MRATAEADANTETLQERPDREPVTVQAGEEGEEAEAKKEEFLQRVQEHEEKAEAKYEEKVETYMTDRERLFASYLTRMWRQAQWIETMQEFPDGKPLCDQKQWHLSIWNIFIRAINRRRYGKKPDQDGDVDAGTQNDSRGGLSGR